MLAEACYASCFCFFCESYLYFLRQEKALQVGEVEPGYIHDCYTAEVGNKFEAGEVLGINGHMIKNRIRKSVQTGYCYIIKYQQRKCMISKNAIAISFIGTFLSKVLQR